MKINKYRILLVDDEKDILEFISYNLKKEGYDVYSVTSGSEAIIMAQKIKPHLVLLDVMMPGMDGIETCEEIRRIPELENIMIVFLTARGEDYSQVAGFEAGGDDYIVKPIRPKVLVSRIKALLKRSRKQYQELDKESEVFIQQDDIVLDREKYIVLKAGKELSLPRKEFELLALLLSRPGKVFTRNEIFQNVWDENIIVGDRTIDVHIRKLREKIGEEHIKTIKGVGYKYII